MSRILPKEKKTVEGSNIYTLKKIVSGYILKGWRIMETSSHNSEGKVHVRYVLGKW